MNFNQLQAITNGRLIGDGNAEVSRYSIDTRTLAGNTTEVFVALKASRDGHDFVDEARRKGVTHFIVEKKIDGPGTYLVVDDTLKALQLIAKNHREQFQYPVIAIAGSNGKTIIKEWLATLLGQNFHIVKSPKSFNSQIGVALSLLEMKPMHTLGIIEAGISRSGEMQVLEEIIQPNLGIFSTLGEAHASGFESREHKLQEKLKLFVNCEKLVCRKDVSWFRQIKESLPEVNLVTWGNGVDADYQVAKTPDGLVVNDMQFKTSLSGRSTMENLAHSIVTALEQKVSVKSIQKGIDRIKAIPMRQELKKGINRCYIIDDSYNNDLVGLRAAIEYMNTYPDKSQKTLVLSDLLHTGLESNQLLLELSEIINSNPINRVIGVGTHIESLGEMLHAKFHHFASTESLISSVPSFHDELILVKGARNYELEKFVRMIEERVHGTVLEVNFEALRYNLSRYRDLLSKSTKMMVMVKANAYGSGILEVAEFLQKQHVDYLGVAYVDEAIALRNNGISLPIMIMNPIVSSFSKFEQYGLEAEIYSLSLLEQYLLETEKPPPIHIKVDTGMHRLGFKEEQIPALLEKLREHPEVKIKSIFTHFSSSDDANHDEFTKSQAAQFERVFELIAQELGYRPLKHASNSSGIVRWPAYHFDMVRLGIGLQGFDPTDTLGLQVVSQLKSEISQIQKVKKGEAVGYSRKGIVHRDSDIAIIPIGYEDGYSRVFGNGKAHMLISNELCPTVGNVCMDMTMVDVTNIDCREGDQVIVFGRNPSIEQLAEISGTIPYEILTNVSSRVKRVFISE